MSSPTGLRDRKRAQTRSALQTAAVELIAERGFDSVSTREIAERAGVSESTLFRTFPTKAAIVVYSAFLWQLVEAVEANGPDVTVDQAVRNAIRLVVAETPPDQWAIEPARRRLVWEHPDLFGANTVDLDLASKRLDAWARSRVDASVHTHTIRLYFSFIFSGSAVAPLTSTVEDWGRWLLIAVDAIRDGIRI